MESFGHPGVEGSYFIKQLAASVVGRKNGESTARKGGGTGTHTSDRLGDQITISIMRVSQVKVQLRDPQEARRRTAGGMTDPHPWREDGAWTPLDASE